MKNLSILIPDDQTNMSTIACIIGSLQLFDAANDYFENMGKEPVFKINLVSVKNEMLLNDGLCTIKSNKSITECLENDLIIIPATLIRSYKTATPNNKILIDWIKKQYIEGAEIASMCVGIFMLASSGLLSGKICSTHWAKEEEFKSLFPDVNIQTDKLITDENGIYTNGGAYSFLHLLMYLVQKFYDRQTAIHCAKYFQIDINRSQQSEFLIFNGHKSHNDEIILEAQLFMENNYQDKFSIEDLSTKFGLSRRNFDRRFIKATDLRPLDYLQRLKVEAAKKAFESTRKSISEVMQEVGYNDTKAFREVFVRIAGITPIAYKEKYNIDLK
jgi:transcriptional regulator GlxA family with amidase domain